MKPSELLEKPEAWCQLTMAKDAGGRKVGPWDKDAVCWCVSGALEKCLETRREREDARDAIVQEIDRQNGGIFHFASPEQWNDHHTRTHAEVLDLLKAVGL